MRNHLTILFFIWAGILLTALVACNTDPEPASHGIFSVPESIEPPLVIRAEMPVVHHVSDNPPPQINDLTSKPAPVLIPAGFF